MREVKVGTFEVKAEVNRTMIEDLNNMRSFDFTAKLEEDLVKKVTRPHNRKNSINKIYSS
jgi:hypothetical protein